MDEQTAAIVNDTNPPTDTTLPTVLAVAAVLVWLALVVSFLTVLL